MWRHTDILRLFGRGWIGEMVTYVLFADLSIENDFDFTNKCAMYYEYVSQLICLQAT